MKTNAAIGIFIVVCAVWFSASEINIVQGSLPTVVFVGACASALIFSVLKRKEVAAMAEDGDTQVLEVGGMGIKARLSGRRVMSADNMLLLILVMQCAQAWFMYQHFTDSAEAQRESIYILSLSPAEREKLNMAMPASLRAKLRRGEQ